MVDWFARLKEERASITKVLLLVLLFFGANVYLCFATDTYLTFESFDVAAKDMLLRNGRPIIALFYELHFLSGLPNTFFYYSSAFFALLFLGAAVWLYNKLLRRYGLSENIGILLAFASIANIYIIEYFMFIEKFGFMLAILFNVIGVWCMNAFWENKNTPTRTRYLIGAIFAMTVAVFTYQGTVALFVILSIPIAFYYAKSFGDYVRNIFAIGFAYATPILLAFVAFKTIFNNTRIATSIDFSAELWEFWWGLQESSRETFSILPPYTFLAVVAIVLLAAVFSSIHTSKKAYLEWLNLLVLVAACCVFPAATILQGSGWWASRTVYPLASIAAALVINSYVNTPPLPRGGGRERNAVSKTISVAVIVTLLVIQYISFNRIYMDKYKSNALDENRCYYIGEAINEYEETNKIKVQKIAFYTDDDTAIPAYPRLFCKDDLIVSSFLTEWSNLNAMNYYLGTDYEKADPVEKYDAYFSSKNWDYLSQEQLIFDGDTLHLCIY